VRLTERQEGDDYIYETAAGDVRFALMGVREDRGDLSAVVRVHCLNGAGAQPLMAPSRLNLVAPRSRADLARMLADRGLPPDMGRDEWSDLVEEACGRTYVLWETGEPMIDLAEVEPQSQERRYLVDPVLVDGETTLWAADGGTGKSTLAAALALALATGREIVPGWRVRGRRTVLYLDWESTAHEHRARINALARAAGYEEVPYGIYYRANYRALADDAGWLRREVARHGIGAVIVDSVIPAASDDIKDAASARALFNALRGLGDSVARLALTHLAKSEAEREHGRARSIGTIMFENLSRSVWELRRSDLASADASTVGFFHRKSNVGARRDAFAVRITYGADGQPSGIDSQDPALFADLEARLPIPVRLTSYLSEGERTTKEIADHLELSERHARRILRASAAVFETAPGGPNRPSKWGVRAWTD
jgi:hypothetical protein